MDFSGLNWQKYIYLNGVAGKRSSVKANGLELEKQACAHMTQRAFAYVAGGAGAESTMRANREAFDKYKIVPHVLRNVADRNMQVELFEQKLSSPFLLAPVGVLSLVHKEADLAASRAAAELNVPFIFSNQASFSMEACAAVMGDSPRWFQLYWSKSNDLVTSFVHRAEKCGCAALVVTLDTTMLGWRPRDLDLGYLPFLEGKGIAQYTTDPVFARLMNEPDDIEQGKRIINFQSVQALISMVNEFPGGGFFRKIKSGKPLMAIRKFVSTYSNPGTTWSDLKFLRAQTKLPIVLKGILHTDDARKALDAGINGIYVSNHGGRQVDGSVSSLEVLPGIAKVVNGSVPIILDSGIRGGADAFKAIALGANAVCIGRPYVYGLAIAGRKGVGDVLRNFIAEFELTMGLSGCKNIREITPDSIR